MRIDDISPTDNTFTFRRARADQSVSGKGLCVAISTGGQRAYLGGHSGVWRSDDGGETWWHPEWHPATVGGPTPAGALPPTNVYDLVIDPTNNDLVFAGTGNDGRQPSASGIYRSSDGAQSWQLVHQFQGTVNGIAAIGIVGRFATVPDDPRTLYAAGQFAIGLTTDRGQSWTEIVPDLHAGLSPVPNPTRPVFHVVAGPPRATGRRVYAIGRAAWYSLDGGATWHVDPNAPILGEATDGRGPSSRAVAIHPQHDNIVYVAKTDLTLWKGVYPEAPLTGSGTWTQIPSPPQVPQTDSGGSFAIPWVTEEGGFTLFLSDLRSVHAFPGEPGATADWARIEDVQCHADPHGLAFTPDFRPWGPDASPPTWGRALLVNDGGVNVSTDGARTWRNARGLSTLNVINVGVNTVPGGTTALTFGTGDNFGFSSADGGATWKVQDYNGGDNDCSFSDPMQPTRMILFAPRESMNTDGKGEIFLFASSSGPPDTSLHSSQLLQAIPAPPPVTDMGGGRAWGWNAVSWYFIYGYRPLVLTTAGQAPRPDGDLVIVRFTGVVGRDPALLLRTTALSQITDESDWLTTATAEGQGTKAFQVGPPLPDPLISSVQASGGHDNPTFYVGNATPTANGVVGSLALWKLAPGANAWEQVVPGTATRVPRVAPTIARCFYVDPYRPNLLYVLGADHVYRSENGGGSWVVDESLDRAVTENGAFPHDISYTSNPAESVLRDMQFDPHRPGFRLAAGIAGVFLTTDGHTWSPLLRSTAVAIQPTSITYDWVACDRSVYVGTSNRGLLRLSPMPPDWEFPIGSLQAAVGQITLLRINDLNTGYGPPYDFLDAEVVVWLDSEPEKAFGLQIRNNADRGAAEGMLALLRDCFNRGRRVRVEFIRTGCRTAKIMRVIEAT